MSGEASSGELGLEPMPDRGERSTLSAEPSKPDTAGGRRELGLYGNGDGPTIVVVAGLHGNEPSGIQAVRRVLAVLAERQPAFKGRLIALAGNLPALRAGQRFVDSDLNRGWRTNRIDDLRDLAAVDAPLRNEDRQAVELIAAAAEYFRTATDDVYVVDLHTTSSISPPFITLGDTLRNRAFARRLPLPFVLGIEEQIDSPMLEYFSEHGAVTVGVEAGQHESPDSVDRHEWALWTVFDRLGCLDARQIPEARDSEARLRACARGMARVFEVRHRRAIEPGDGFAMHPGFRNFQPVRQGEVVAEDATGEIAVPEDGYLFLPLYQALGDDGLFIVRPVARIWLHVSWLLRQFRLARIVHWLPGVYRLPNQPDTVLVSRKIARWLAVEFFHLLGFRRDRVSEDFYVFGRRSYDLHPPGDIDAA